MCIYSFPQTLSILCLSCIFFGSLGKLSPDVIYFFSSSLIIPPFRGSIIYSL